MADTDDQLDELFTAIFNRPRRGPGAVASCGTAAGYRRHRRNGEQPCPPCTEANTTEQRENFNSPVKRPSQLKPIAHGTLGGYKQHRYRREQACEECLAAQRDYQRGHSAGKPRKAAAPKPKQYLTEEEWQARAASRQSGGAE
ncbi:hypothetical protein [Streptomyces sp. NPDC059224]|uniref:hypothetical protein n=1 Tax=Streptomyces sp. NPDC059224 TaxID=3346775 RepID=UPI00369AF2D2